MNCRLILIVAIAFASSRDLRCMSDKLQPFATSALLVFLENGEAEDGPVTWDVLAALEQKAAPCLVSVHTLRNIFTVPTWREFIEKLPEADREKYGDLKKYYDTIDLIIQQKMPTSPEELISVLNDPKKWIEFKGVGTIDDLTRIKQSHAALHKAIHEAQAQAWSRDRKAWRALMRMFYSFRQEDWLVKRVDEHIMLFVPKAYIELIERPGNFVAKAKGFSALEAALGLQVEHLEDVPEVVEVIKKYKDIRGDFNLLAAFNKIFVPKTAYVQESAESKAKKAVQLGTYFVPTWALYMVGHGMTELAVVNIPIEQFKQCLDFLEKKINTKLLIYESCYAAGTNTELIYKGLESGQFKTYSFAIAMSALFEAPTTGVDPIIPQEPFNVQDIDFDHKKLKIRFGLQFNDFVKAMSFEGVDYVSLLAPVLPGMNEKHLAARGMSNSPRLKLPGIPWFNAIDAKRRLVVIGKNLAQTRKQDLNVTDFFKIKAPLGILLYTNYVPFTLNLERIDPLSKIISMTRDTTIYIKGIMADASIDKLVETFEIAKDENLIKRFWIGSLSVLLNNKREVLNDILISVGGEGANMYDLSLNRTYDKNTHTWQPTPEFLKAVFATYKEDLQSDSSINKAIEKEQQFEAIRRVQEKKREAKTREDFEARLGIIAHYDEQLPQALTLLEQSLMTLNQHLGAL